MKTTIKNEIIEVVKRHQKPLTAGQIAKYIPRRSREGILKRISELFSEDVLVKTGRDKCPVTQRSSSLYKYNPKPNPENKKVTKTDSCIDITCSCDHSCHSDTPESLESVISQCFESNSPSFTLVFYSFVLNKILKKRLFSFFLSSSEKQILKELSDHLNRLSQKVRNND